MSRLLSRLVDAADGLGSLRSAVLLAVVGAAPLPLALARMDERSVLLGGLLGRFDLASSTRNGLASPAASFARCSLSLLPARRGLLLAALALGFLLGQVALDRRRRDPARELVEHPRPGQYLRLVDALPVGSGSPDVSASRCATSSRSTTASAASGVRARLSAASACAWCSFSASAPRG